MTRVVVAGLAALVLTTAAFGQEAPNETQVEWLKKAAVPFRTVEAGSGFEDLEALRAIVGNARVVGLGESTHGSREQFQMKHRLVEFLVEEMGFSIFSIEASMPESYAVDDYVSRGEGDPADLIRGMYFWTWSTEEVRAMVEWMHAFNVEQREAPAESRKSVRFTGFDMQTPDVAARIVRDGLAAVDEELATSVGEQYDAMIATRRTSSWTSATSGLTPALVAGKSIELRARVKTEDAEYAALWFRADDAGRSVAFQNTQAQHRSTDGWIEHKVELDIPDGVDAVLFGFIHAGGGRAWFDDLRLTIDGEPWTHEEYDFAMEEDARGFRVMSADYRGRLDADVAASGKSSFRIERVTPLPKGGEMQPEEARHGAEAICDRLRDRSDALTEKLGPRQSDWIHQMARVVAQCMEGRASGSGAVRDRAMADNVVWILEQDPEAKVILWAHNAHIANDTVWMGRHLEDALGDDYVPIGFATSRGEYRAVDSGGKSGLGNHALHAAPSGSIESFFEAAELDLAILDLRDSAPGSAASGWLHETRPQRSIGALEMPTMQFFPAVAFPKFEVLIYTAETTGAEPLR